MRHTHLIGAVLSLLFLVAHPSVGWAQLTGTITGTLEDETGALLPGATVTVRHVDTAVARTMVTDDTGSYEVPGLLPGRYEVRAELPGFQTVVRGGITLTVGQEAVVDMVMRVGEMTEQVVVVAEAPRVDTRSAVLSEVVDEKKIRDLPLNGRDLSQLVLLQPAVTQPRSKVRKLITSTGLAMNISGQRDISSVFLLDGTDIVDARGSASSAGGPLTGVETIREFRVLTNAYSAEYGKALGGVVIAVTKTGTNEFHGSAFHFHRNDDLDARNFFDPLDGAPEFKRNQFGFSLGGPIVRDRTFFFGSYEGLRERLGLTILREVPSADARRGFLPDPSTGELRLVGVNPAVRPFLDLYPPANGRDFGDGTAENVSGFSQPTDEDFFTVRIDHQFSPGNSLFGRYSFSDSEREVVTSNRYVPFPEADTSRNQFLTLQQTHAFSARALNTFRFGFSRTTPTQGEANEGPRELAFVPGREFGTIIVGAFDSDLGTDNSTPRKIWQNLFEYSDDVNIVAGSHSVKAGLKIQRYQQNTTFADRIRGEFEFRTVEDLLRARASRFRSATPDSSLERSFRFTTFGFYVQDEIRVRPNLTLNAGLRYEFTTVPSEKFDRLSAIRDPLRDKEFTVGKPFENPSLRNWGPRVGLSWDPTGSGKTALRAGFGIFYQPLPTHAFFFASAVTSMPPFFKTGDLRGSVPFPSAFAELSKPGARIVLTPRALEWDVQQPKVYQYNLNLQRELGPDMVVTVGYAGAQGRNLQRLNNVNTRLPRIVDGRISFDAREPLRNPNFGEIRLFHTDASSFYHSLIVSATKRFSHGWQFQTSYTLSKSIDDGSTVTGGDFPGFLLGERSVDFKKIDRGLSIFDTRQNAVFNATYDLPIGPGRLFDVSGTAGKLLGGWQLNGIVSLASGNPISGEVNRRLDRDQDGSVIASGFADLAPGVAKIPKPETPDRWFDPNAFRLPPQGTFGNAGRNIIIGPGLATVDFSLVKKTPVRSVSKEFNIEFKAEFFNIFNRANFSQPLNIVFLDGSGVPSGQAGRITSTTTSSRQVQFGLKVIF